MLDNVTHVHFIGIGGIGMSGLAKLLLAQGKTITGSDLVESPITQDLQRRGVVIAHGHHGEYVDVRTDLVIYSSAVPESNEERRFAKEQGIVERSYAEALGEYTKQFSTIVVTGTHGKSTTTAMLGLILEAAGYDPTILVGSLVPSFPDGNIRIGNSRFFVVEGCEYQANILNLHPESIVLTNIEMDHPDFYRDIDHVRNTFKEFIDRLSGNGLVVLNIDDPQSKMLVTERSITFGTDATAQYRIEPEERPSLPVPPKPGKGGWSPTGNNVYRKENGDQPIGSIALQIPGQYNRHNALAAIATAMELGIPFATCKQALESFRGIWRRFEHVGSFNGIDVISDYGHHPTAIAATVQAAKEFYPDRRIVLCYQPHQHARTKKLFNEFVDVFSKLNIPIIIAEVYDVAGRNEDQAVSSRDLVAAVGLDYAVFAKDLFEAETLIRKTVVNNDVLIVMGAGDIDELARKLV